MRMQLSSRVWLVILIGYWGTMFVSTHIPDPLTGLASQGSDKVLHVTAFCVLAVLVALNAECQFGELRLRHYAVLAIVLAVYGALDEILQQFVGRHCSFKDWMSDVCGAILGLWLFNIFRLRILQLVRH